MKRLNKLLFVIIQFNFVLLYIFAANLYGANPIDASIAGGRYHTIALKDNGTVWAWGSNSYGQLGDGTTTNKTTPVPVSDLTGVTAIAGGGYHTIALKEDGTVWAWGGNSSGQLGDGPEPWVPVQVKGEGGAGYLELFIPLLVDLKGGGNRCFIATACYGTPMAEDVITLRKFRDEYLLTNAPGRLFVRTYYKTSPPAANFIAKHPMLKNTVRVCLKPLVWMSRTLVKKQ